MEKLVDKTPSDTERGNCGKYQVAAAVHSSGHLTKYISTVHFNNITTHMCEEQGLKTFRCKKSVRCARHHFKSFLTTNERFSKRHQMIF